MSLAQQNVLRGEANALTGPASKLTSALVWRWCYRPIEMSSFVPNRNVLFLKAVSRWTRSNCRQG